MTKLIVLLRTSHGTELAVTVPLPLDVGARAIVQAQLDDPAMKLMASPADREAFWDVIRYLPETQFQLEIAERVSAAIDWHTACAIAKGGHA